MVTDKTARRLLRLLLVMSIGIIVSIPLLAFPKWDFIMFGFLAGYVLTCILNMINAYKEHIRLVVPLLLLMMALLSIPLIALAKITLGG